MTSLVVLALYNEQYSIVCTVHGLDLCTLVTVNTSCEVFHRSSKSLTIGLGLCSHTLLRSA